MPLMGRVLTAGLVFTFLPGLAMRNSGWLALRRLSFGEVRVHARRFAHRDGHWLSEGEDFLENIHGRAFDCGSGEGRKRRKR